MPQIRLPPAVNISHQNIRGVHSEHTQNFIYPSLKCKWPIHTKLLAPNDLISLSYRTQYCVWNDNVYYELKKKIRLKYLSATWPVLEDFLGFLKVSLSRHNDLFTNLIKSKFKDRHTILMLQWKHLVLCSPVLIHTGLTLLAEAWNALSYTSLNVNEHSNAIDLCISLPLTTF